MGKRLGVSFEQKFRQQDRRLRMLLHRIDDIRGTIDLVWHHFIGPLWDKLVDIQALLDQKGVKVDPEQPVTADEALRRHCMAALARNQNNITRTAKELAIARKSLQHWLARWEKRSTVRLRTH